MKKIILTLTIVAVSVMTIVGLCSFIGQNTNTTEKSVSIIDHEHHSHVEGKYCTATVGCDCRGFQPITDGKEYQKNYCKRCGHHKKYHK